MSSTALQVYTNRPLPNKYGLLTKCSVKMAGYWPSFFACLSTETGSRSIKSQKKNEANIQQAWSIKDLLYSFRGTISSGKRRVVPSGEDSSILPPRVANHSAGSDPSCPLTELPYDKIASCLRRAEKKYRFCLDFSFSTDLKRPSANSRFYF